MVACMRRRVDSSLLLLLATPLLWGATFPGTKLALRRLPPLTFMAWSRTLGFVSILVMVPLLRRSESNGNTTAERRAMRKAIGPGLFLGALIFVAYFLQTEGLARTTATNAGFITGLYVVFTPILAALLFRQRVPGAAWAAVGISVVGLALLSIQNLGAIRLHAGDLLVLAGSAAWAGHVVGVGHFSPRFPAWVLSLAQMGVTAAFQLVAVAATGLRAGTATSTEVWPLLILTGVLGSGVAYTLQIMAQQSVTATRAVVLLAGEALFAALFSAIWIGERLAVHQWAGAALVLASMAFSELAARRPPAERLEPASAL
jgi:drug/metabolite transporter (DMT)-like permease